VRRAALPRHRRQRRGLGDDGRGRESTRWCRPGSSAAAAALATAYNGASVGGVVLSPLWVALIGALGFPAAAAFIGGARALALWVLAGRCLAHGPAALGQQRRRDDAGTVAARPPSPHAAAPRQALWRNRALATARPRHLTRLSRRSGSSRTCSRLLVAPFGAQLAGFAAGLATASAVVGRTGPGVAQRPRRPTDGSRRRAIRGGLQIGARSPCSGRAEATRRCSCSASSCSASAWQRHLAAAADRAERLRAGRHGPRRGARHGLLTGGLRLRARRLRRAAQREPGGAVSWPRRPCRCWPPWSC
jgi:hypothetical protein